MKPFCAAFILCCLVCAGRAFGAGSAERKPALGGRTVQGSDALQSAASGENASSEGGNEKNETKEMPDTAQTADVKSPDADGSESVAIDRFSRDAEGKLKAFAFEAERFTLSDVNGESVTVNASGEKAVRKTYDALMRLVKRDVWKIASTAKESVRESTETFYYKTEGAYPASSVTEREGCREERFYDDEGRVISRTDFFVDFAVAISTLQKMRRRFAAADVLINN